ncbi:hypothetical protein ACIHEI_34040 [Kitasatospora sp. NPDC051984]|uniref:hypothetical protein n=1 Tax=Kitasatospora sp. NPDC051984 TaxID=3364059 RepID=UPI0037C88998
MSDTRASTGAFSGLFNTATATAGPGSLDGIEIVDAEIVEDTVPTAGADGRTPHWWETQRIYPPSPPPPPAPPSPPVPPVAPPSADWAAQGWTADAAMAAPAYYAPPPPPPPFVPAEPQFGYPDPGAVTPVEVVAPQPIPVMVVAPPEPPQPFWDFSWMQLGANATAAAIAAVPAWLLHHYRPGLTGSYGADAAAAIAILWGGKSALRSLAVGCAAYYGCHFFHANTATTAAVELVAIALPLAGAKRAEVTPLRRVAVWFPILAGCLSLPAISQAITWLTTAFTGGN